MKRRKAKTMKLALPRGKRSHRIVVNFVKWKTEVAPPRSETLEKALCRILAQHCGERGHSEGAEETLRRIIYERDRALTVLALDRLKQ